MPEDSQQPTPNQFTRPSVRPGVVGAPMQRANYGIPARQSTPLQQPAQGQPMMDVIAPAPRPAQPAPVQPVAAVPPQPQPQQQPYQAAPQPVQPMQPVPPVQQPVAVPQPVAAAPTPALPTTAPLGQRPAPMFTANQSTQAPQKPRKEHRIIPKFRFVFLVIGLLLTIGGAARIATAGDVSGYVVAVGAVTANDGRKTSIQFTADDGKLHHFTVQGSKRNQIPGTAIEVAYQSGASDATVKQVAIVKSAHNLGVEMLSAGILFLAIGTVWVFVHHRKNRPAAVQQSQAVPVAA